MKIFCGWNCGDFRACISGFHGFGWRNTVVCQGQGHGGKDKVLWPLQMWTGHRLLAQAGSGLEIPECPTWSADRGDGNYKLRIISLFWMCDMWRWTFTFYLILFPFSKTPSCIILIKTWEQITPFLYSTFFPSKFLAKKENICFVRTVHWLCIYLSLPCSSFRIHSYFVSLEEISWYKEFLNDGMKKKKKKSVSDSLKLGSS